MPDEVKMRMSRQQASALHQLLLCYLLTCIKPESDLPREWVNVIDDSSVSADELLTVLVNSYMPHGGPVLQ